MPPTPAQIGAFAVHALTASGVAFGLMALIWAAQGDWSAMFLWLGAAMIIDGADGALARRIKVAEVLPRWSGDVLDLVVDFTTYVFVPAFAIAVSGLLPPGVNFVLAAAIVISAALYFADNAMKMPGNYFRGFPALWNFAAFYLFLLRPAPWVATLALLVLVGLTFAPFRFVHPSRVRRWRHVNMALVALWSLLALVALLRDFAPGPWVTIGLCVIAAYFFAFGLVRHEHEQGLTDA